MQNCVGTFVLHYLRLAFYYFGLFIGQQRVSLCVILASSLTAIVLGAGIFNAYLPNSDVRLVFCPSDAVGWEEERVYADFFKNSAHPYQTYAFVQAKNGQSLFSTEPVDYMQIIANISKFVENNVSATVGNATYTYRALCGRFCGRNYLIGLLNNGLQFMRNRTTSGILPKHGQTRIAYPNSIFFYQDIFVGGTLFGVKSESNFTDHDWLINVTPIKHVQMIKLDMMMQYKNKEENVLVKQLDRRLSQAIEAINNPHVNIWYYGGEPASVAVVLTGLRTIPYYGLGLIFMFIFVAGSLTIAEATKCQNGQQQISLVTTSFIVITPLLATISSFGICLLTVRTFEPILTVVPFLVLAIGVDDGFLLTHAWRQTDMNLLPEVRLGKVLQNIGPSILITSLTNSVAFACGVFSTTPIIGFFCQIASLAMAFDFFYQITFFAAVLPLQQRCYVFKPTKAYSTTLSSFCTKLKNISVTGDKWLKQYCKLISTWKAFGCVLIFMIVYITVVIHQTLIMESDLSAAKLIHSTYPIKTALLKEIKSHSEYVEMSILVNSPPNFTDPVERCEFEKMMHEIETMHGGWGHKYTQSLVYHLDSYITVTPGPEPKACTGLYIRQFLAENCTNVGKLASCTSPHIDKYLEAFFLWGTYEQHRPLVQLTNGRLSKFMFTVPYKTINKWADYTEMVLSLRQIAQKYPQFNITSYYAQTLFVDQVLELWTNTFKTMLTTFCCMVIICILLLPEIWTVISAALSVASMSIGISGFLCVWKVKLDPISMCSMFMAIGLSVDYTAHISYHFHHNFQQNSKHVEVAKTAENPPPPLRVAERAANQLYDALQDVGLPTIQAGLSTLLCVSFLGLGELYMSTVFLKTVFILVTLGLFHGLVILPAAFCATTKINAYFYSLQK